MATTTRVPYVSDFPQIDVSHIALLRKRLGRAAFSMKFIGLASALWTAAFLGFDVNVWVGAVLGIVTAGCAFVLANRMRSGHTAAAWLVGLWVVVWGAVILLTYLVLATTLLGRATLLGQLIGLALFVPTVYWAIRGLVALRAYKSQVHLKSIQGGFEPLSLNPWEDGSKNTRKHPKLLNKSSVVAYVLLILTTPLVALLGLVLLAGGLTGVSGGLTGGTMPVDTPVSAINDLAHRAGYLMGAFFVYALFSSSWGLLTAYLYRRARRQAMLPGSRLLRKDHRAPVLYLRSFRDDRAFKMRARATDGRIFLERFPKISFEEVVADHLWRYGPVIAIGDPRTKGRPAPLGAARDYESDATWRQKAEDWMSQASLIVAVVGPTEGFIWEIDTIIAWGFTSKLVLVLPPAGPYDLRTRWEYLASKATGMTLPQQVDLRRVRAVVFPAGQAVTITADDWNDWTYEAVLDTAAALILDPGRVPACTMAIKEKEAGS